MTLFRGEVGSANAGGTSWCMFANDGGISFLGLYLTWVFASFVHVARPLQTC
jgi:hypothetical protein